MSGFDIISTLATLISTIAAFAIGYILLNYLRKDRKPPRE